MGVYQFLRELAGGKNVNRRTWRFFGKIGWTTECRERILAGKVHNLRERLEREIPSSWAKRILIAVLSNPVTRAAENDNEQT